MHTTDKQRIGIMDALRGSALFGILLLHAVEHWDFMRPPEHRSAWMAALDAQVTDAAYFLFGGKAYAIFALMFGLSFFVILARWQDHGRAASGRFVWRLALLGAMGWLHGLLYCGDILAVIALLGLPLVLLNRLGTRSLCVVALLLLLQLPQWPEVQKVLADPTYQPPPPRYWGLYGQTDVIFAGGSFGDVLRLNAWTGQAAKWWWTIETCRYTQMLGLFVCGLLLGRSGVVNDEPRLRRLAVRALVLGAAGFALVALARHGIDMLHLEGMRQVVVGELVNAYANLAQAALWAGGFAMLYQWQRTAPALRLFEPYGRMSLTCYVTQAVIGVPFFYGFGLGMYRFVGPAGAVGFALVVFALQWAFARAWLERFAYGPLEWLWRAATLRTLAVPMRRRMPARLAPGAR